MIILAIDPGQKESGFVYLNTGNKSIIGKGICENNQLWMQVKEKQYQLLAIENIRGYGIVAGDNTFDTCIWIGRFDYEQKAILISRKDIKKHLCGNITTTDKYIRQALIDRFGKVGTKKKPGVLFGISGHMWAALAVGVTVMDKYGELDI